MTAHVLHAAETTPLTGVSRNALPVQAGNRAGILAHSLAKMPDHRRFGVGFGVLRGSLGTDFGGGVGALKRVYIPDRTSLRARKFNGMFVEFAWPGCHGPIRRGHAKAIRIPKLHDAS
jgi:hypothetical protein